MLKNILLFALALALAASLALLSQSPVTVSALNVDYAANTVAITGVRGGGTRVITCNFTTLSCNLDGAAARTMTQEKADRIRDLLPSKTRIAQAVLDAYQADPAQ